MVSAPLLLSRFASSQVAGGLAGWFGNDVVLAYIGIPAWYGRVIEPSGARSIADHVTTV